MDETAMSRLEQAGVWAGIVGAIAGVIALWPIFVTPSPPPPAPPPQIPDYSTGWIEGEGKSTPDYCNPRKAALQQKYPEFRIEMSYLPEQHKENRDGLGFKHDRYMYGCSFSAHRR